MPEDAHSEALRAFEDARTHLEEAHALARPGFWRPAIRASYYAMFHAERAMLLAEGIRTRTHKGALAEFTRRFVRDGTFPPETAISLNRALAERMSADYGAAYQATEERAEWAVQEAERILGQVERELEKRTKGSGNVG